VNERPLTVTPPGEIDAFLVERASVIRALGKRVARDIVEIGRLLAECKKHVGHGGWPQWLKREFGWSDDSALRFMQVHELVNSRNLRDLTLPVILAAVLLPLASPAWAQEAVSYRDPSLTPGAIRSTDAAEICAAGTNQFRHWDRERSDLIFARYHIARENRMAYTLDHLIPLEIGGADVVENLWPEPRRSLAGEWDDTRKDQLERRLAVLVCSGQLDVREAQHMIADDWTAAFVKFVGEPR
jgi:hypothetical protein